MKHLSLDPDEHMKWIYDPSHPDYNSDHAKWLRERRSRALANAPRWMAEEASYNDILRDLAKGDEK